MRARGRSASAINVRIPRYFGASAGLSVDKETDEWEGDVWLRNVQPLGLDVVTQALAARGEVPVPMVELGGRAAAMKLDSNYTKATGEPIDVPELYRGAIEVCGGLLMPASVLDGKTQSWTTTCKGSYLENRWAEYRLDAQGWRVANW